MFITDAWSDFKSGVLQYELWSALAFSDIHLRFRASVIGPLWLTLNTLVFILTLGFVFSTVFKTEISVYLPYLSTGLMIWTMLSSVVTEASTLFKVNASFVRNVHLPISTYIFRLLLRNLLIILFHLPITLLVLLYYGLFTSIDLPMLFIGTFLVFVLLTNLAIVISLVAARFVDIEPIIQAVLQVVFLTTPIIWSVDIMADRAVFVSFNPIYHLVELMRAPFLGKAIANETWIFVGVMVLVTTTLSAVVYRKFYHRIAYWV